MNLNQYSDADLVQKRSSLRRALLGSSGLQPIRIAVLGGSTTQELVDFWELYLLSEGFEPSFFQTEYGRYHVDAVVSPQEIIEFQPNIAYVHTSIRNLNCAAPLSGSDDDLKTYVRCEVDRYRQIWDSIAKHVGCQLIQNNFELPITSVLGNLDAVLPGGGARFVGAVNAAFAEEATKNPKLILNDIHGISARVGLSRWFEDERWYGYKISNTIEGTLEIARSLTAIVRALLGRSRKCLVLDLDNTLWGGVIGDDGADNIIIGQETPMAEAFSAFQRYCLSLRDRGILLAICSKNDEEIAKQGFEHPDSILKAEHFAASRINWNPKHENIKEMALELNLGLESFVFVDDNPMERDLVSKQIPEVAVPNVGSEVSDFIGIIDAQRYFEAISLGAEDLSRAQVYRENVERVSLESTFTNYGDFLDSLGMSAEIECFRPAYIERIAQLTNKTNQFNLTTRRYTLAEIDEASKDPSRIGVYGRLADRFGDHGLVSVVLGEVRNTELHLDLWLMSCRVLKRSMELAMLDRIVELADAVGVATLVGYYRPTKKNGMVSGHYRDLGFSERSVSSSESSWVLKISDHVTQNKHINVSGARDGQSLRSSAGDLSGHPRST